MQISPQQTRLETTITDAGSHVSEFARQLAQAHTVGAGEIPAKSGMFQSLRMRAGLFFSQKNDVETPPPSAQKRKANLLENLKTWELVLGKANAAFKSAPSKSLAISRAGEWMQDNFYVVKQTFRQVEEDLPTNFLSQLPRLPGTAQQTHTRIFALAWEWIGYCHGQLDLTQAAGFVRDYQQVTPLTIGELWALPIMLRIGILERLVYAVTELTGMETPNGLSEIPGQITVLKLANEQIVANCFLSLRLLAATDWDDFFEQTSRVEQILRGDPAGVYAAMDFNTRNSYRNVIEELAQHSAFSEIVPETARGEIVPETARGEIVPETARGVTIPETARGEIVPETARGEIVPETARGVTIPDLARCEESVALAAIRLAQTRSGDLPGRPRQAHVGYYLRDAGRAALEIELRCVYRPEFNVRAQHALLAAPTASYLGSILLFSVLFWWGLLAYAGFSGGSPAQLLVTALLGAGLALESAIALIQWNVTHRIRPQSLPRMDFSDGIPAGNRTMVVVPTLLESPDELEHLLGELELYHISNPDPLLTYALLTDFVDASTEHMPKDNGLLTLARAGIEALNKKYENARPFYLFHRPRQWNPSEGVWMGWERKRGKLADFNHLLLNLRNIANISPQETAYISIEGQIGILSEIKYVITLDADTSLPQDSANRLIATLAHPLNKAEFAPDGRSVIAGYTVLQPRVSIKPTSANRSLFSQIFAGNAGFDLYSFAVSDVYQDLFGEGSYVGKGIYDVAAFERSLAGQVRQNTLLSHDLFEGIYGRAALVTDIVLYEEYPSRYLVYASRLRRWIRGDWQLLPWMFPIVSTSAGPQRNRLSAINLWKVFDNLRRSLLPPTLLALLVAGWLFLPGSALVWTILVLLPSALPLAVHIIPETLRETVRKVPGNRKRATLKQLFKPARLPLTRWALAIVFLPYEALLMLGAIRTTLARLLIGRRHLLQWTTAATAARATALNPMVESWREMAAPLALTILLGVATAIVNPVALWVALPFLAAWLIAPQIAYQISKPVIHTTTPLSEPQRRQVLRLARRTWAFFERFAGPNDHWLPPDHFQEAPRGSIAHYTTPTNIGLFLVSTLSAYDLGYLGLSELAIRLRSTLESMTALEHYRGHLLNWYDSQSMTALPPRYISTVDSGNLAACLITLKQGCLALTEARLFGDKQWQGLLVIMDILTESLLALEKDTPEAHIESFQVELTGIYLRLSAAQNHPADWLATLTWLSGQGWARVSQRLIDLLENHPNMRRESLTELQLYLDLMQHQIQDMQRSLELFAPWLPIWRTLQTPPAAGLSQAQAAAWQVFLQRLPAELPTLGSADAVYARIQTDLGSLAAQLPAQEWAQTLADGLTAARQAVSLLSLDFQSLAGQADSAVAAMDFRFLYSERRQVFHIGYNASLEQLDPSYYDLLASEARIASLIAIARGDVPQSHWQHLGRPVTITNGKQVLLSWSGTMFEYLMPGLFTRNYTGTFISDSCFAAVGAQISYAEEQSQIPWGISESGYYAFDLNLNYQYRAFGAPELGYKRDLPDDLVISPYASLMALPLQPQAVLKNMAHLEKLNMLGRFGFFEAIDYTKSRLPAGQDFAIVQSYMAHHQGMILLSACNYLLEDVMVRRFHADERIQSVELLLQEKIPPNPPIEFPHSEQPMEALEGQRLVNSAPWRVPVDSGMPQVHVLEQSGAHLLITNAGGGYSQWRDFALTRWQADATLDACGTWIYVQDCESGALWSATCQPIGCGPEKQEVLFYPHKVEFQRSDNGISLRTGVTISPDGVEIRRVNILNDSEQPRKLRFTSYGEVVLAEQAADRRHPAFNKLFIESEYLPREHALLFQRRPRSADEKPVVLIHALVIEAGRKFTGEYESDRAQFLGRSQTAQTPHALDTPGKHLPGGVGGTLDPIFSLAQEVELQPHAKTRVTFLTLAAATRAEALEKLSRYQTGQAIHRAFDEARARTEHELVEQGLNAYTIENIQRIYSSLLSPAGALRAAPHILAQNRQGQSGLWAFGISGDYPILLVRILDGESPLLSEAVQAFIYWRSRRATVNLVILNDQETGYTSDLHNAIQNQLRRMGVDDSLNQRNGIFVLRTDLLKPADRILLETVAGVILDERTGSLAEHAQRLRGSPGSMGITQPTHLPAFTPVLSSTSDAEPTPPLPLPVDLLMDNTLGGFSQHGREYVIHLLPGQHTPHPWVNVIANPQFGFLVSETGSGSTWALNSGENRLTPWRNDPLIDMPAEALYLRDEETGLVWSPTLMPAGAVADTAHLIRHGAGYSIFESQSHGLNQKLRLFAAPQTPLKIVHVRLQNLWQRPRRITVTYYAEWVLGTTRDAQQAHIMPEFDSKRHALLASNHYNSEFGERVAFLAASKKPHGLTTDRTEFLGRLGSLRAPAALGRIGLTSAVNAGLDPCAVIQLHVDLPPGATEELFFLLGQGADRAESLQLIEQAQAPGQIKALWQAVGQQWDTILSTITVVTPDPGMDIMLNRWLLYQTLACRLWGRTALYQSSGAFGFRDQLQDVLTLLHSRPDLAREQILEAARHQFEAGDVLHWWNPPLGRGVRTRFSDDLLWLPYVTAGYITATGDTSILTENLPFLSGEELKAGEMERYAQFETGSASASLYEHCRRALKKGSTAGAHGLPLMGGGDWNDGMNRVGMAGRGESVWLGWFLHAALQSFAQLAELMQADPAPYRHQAEQLSRALEAQAWDGEWYLRAFYDDGSPLGSRSSTECQIDSIAQSWAVLSGAADPPRAAQAMNSVSRLLVKPLEQMILLFTPPFDKTEHDPGYIKGYLPGIRENGGQYTHAAIWTAWAFALLGQADRALDCFHMLNPISHTDTPSKIARYKVEPYVIAADIYSMPPHTGSGGWTWYTGSSGWMYRLGIEAILGISRQGDALSINPCIPANWPGFKVDYRFGGSHYRITIENPHNLNRGAPDGKIFLDGSLLTGRLLPLLDDGQPHEVRVVLEK